MLRRSSVVLIRTIDLAYLLAHFGIKFRFLTTTKGVDPTFESEPFYRPTIDADRLRVNKLFDAAASNKMTIEQRSIAPDALQVHSLCAAS